MKLLQIRTTFNSVRVSIVDCVQTLDTAMEYHFNEEALLRN